MAVSGGAIVVGVAASSSAIVLRQDPALWWLDGAGAGLAARWRAGRSSADAAIGAAVVITCAVVARAGALRQTAADRRNHPLFQARIFAGGHLWLPAPAHPEFTSAMHLLDWQREGVRPVSRRWPGDAGDRRARAHAEWLVGPVCTGVGVVPLRAPAAAHRTARWHRARRAAAVRAVAVHGLPRRFDDEPRPRDDVAARCRTGAGDATTDDRRAPRAALAMGLCLGIAATIRPMDAAAFALPAAVWLLVRRRATRFGTPSTFGLALS